MFLEISAIGAACKKNPFETMEKTLLSGWGRHNKKTLLDFLIRSNCVTMISNDTDTYDELCSKIYDKHATNVNNVDSFKQIEDTIVKEFTDMKETVTDSDIKQVKAFVSENIKKDYGKTSERETLKRKINLKPGNTKMYYHKIGNNKIGGLHDAFDGECLVEIKSRIKQANVRKNEYDLYQLFGYLLALNATKGKIIQTFQGTIFESDKLTTTEYGIIDIQDEYWNDKIQLMLLELDSYFSKLEHVMNCVNVDDDFLQKAIPLRDRPIFKLTENMEFRDVNQCYSNLINNLR